MFQDTIDTFARARWFVPVVLVLAFAAVVVLLARGLS